MSQTLDLQNSELAFRYLKTPELWRASLLFRAMGNTSLVRMGPQMVELAMKTHLPISPLVQHTLYKQFVGGATVTDCQKTIAKLSQYGVQTILDYAVEGGQAEDEFDETAVRLRETINLCQAYDSVSFAVFKITGLCQNDLLRKVSEESSLTASEQKAWERAEDRVMSICRLAFEQNVQIMIDAEESWMQAAIDQLAHKAMALFNGERAVVYNTVQMYRHDRSQFLKNAIVEAEKGGYHYGVKLVRGAYMEKERDVAAKAAAISPIHVDKHATDAAYDEMLDHCLDRLDRVEICAGTHNEASTYRLAHALDQRGISRSDRRVCFSQLLGMSDNLTFNLAHHGYRVAKYMPYGPVVAVLPYLFRRAQENSSIKGQVGRELALINEELNRRKRGRFF